MDNRILLEDIKRMHKLIGISPNILIESVITENVIDKEAAAIFKSIFTNIERSVVAGGKSYTKNQVKQVIGKIGSVQLTNEEKILVQTLTRDAIALDKQLIKRFSNEIFGEMQKLTNRRARSAYYARVKKGLKEVLPKKEFDSLISNVNAKLNIQPKPTPTPGPTPGPNTTSGPNPAPPIVGSSLTDDVIIGSLKAKFKELNIPYKLTAKQEKFFIDELRSLTNTAYEQIKKELPEDFENVALRFQSLSPTKQREIIIEAQKKIKESLIGVGAPLKQIIQLNRQFDKLLEGLRFWKGDTVRDKVFNFITFNVGLTVTDMLINSINKGKLTSENVFGLSWKQQVLSKGFTSAILTPLNIGKKLNIIYTVVMSAVAINSKDKSEQLGDFPISINDAKEYIESSSNPLEREKDESGKYLEVVTKYEPVDKDLKPMEGDKGAFIKIYINDAYFGALQKDITGKIKIK